MNAAGRRTADRAPRDPSPPTPVSLPGQQTWNRQRLRSNNEWLLLERLRVHGPLSRAQLARDTGLSKPTVSAALAALELAGLAREAGRFAPDRGRTAVLYEADPAAGHVLGLDIGRARLRVAVADLSGRIVARRDLPNRGRSANAVADAAVAAAQEAIAEAGLTPAGIAHTVAGSPGVWDERRRSVQLAANLPGWGRPGLFDRIAQGLGSGRAVTVANDANLAAVGEYTYGAGGGSRLFVYLLVGTGLGVGVVKDGELLTGAHGAAGELGLLRLPGCDVPPGTESDPTLEQTVSADAVVRTALGLGMRRPLSAEKVFAEARSGDPAAAEAVRLEADRLGYALAVVAALLDPDVVVLGGGIGRSADLLLRPLEEALHGRSPMRPRLEATRLGQDAVLLGAVATALEAARPEVFERRTAAVS
ncbi:ROK family protein [Streptomyces sp. SP17BM10]|uniref:ROK family protein n=1 Tax=Streptomyces sp. SP17BM10 TaxID=3002530 RepID=UPI002E78CBDD|nr:ROK family protein [Streptomyces sp. SP17BM10]MEE1788454.1 ROK family protein [Streptomyces sp. SP17BM10]